MRMAPLVMLMLLLRLALADESWRGRLERERGVKKQNGVKRLASLRTKHDTRTSTSEVHKVAQLTLHSPGDW